MFDHVSSPDVPVASAAAGPLTFEATAPLGGVNSRVGLAADAADHAVDSPAPAPGARSSRAVLPLAGAAGRRHDGLKGWPAARGRPRKCPGGDGAGDRKPQQPAPAPGASGTSGKGPRADHTPARLLVSKVEAAACLGISVDTFDGLKLPRIQIGRRVLFKVAELERFVESR